MKTSALREMTKDELVQKLNEIREAQFNLTFQQATGQLDNTAQLPRNKKDIARILTILAEMDSKAGA
ncbi:MAG TPA: 50S ribosomal protein L29 [Deltaproteobacteria bacterium]|nr:50S ribosomal protein L29 [Deltaproteobacteria bacterium]